MTDNTKSDGAVTRLAKRKLSSISFAGKDAHLALVHKDQGGPASGANYKLVLKNVRFTDEYIQKMQAVKVTMELPDFILKFFNTFNLDAMLLAKSMGCTALDYDNDNYEDYIQSKLESFEVLKAVHDAESIAEVLSGLDETQYLAMLHDQALVEKALNKMEAKVEAKVDSPNKDTKEFDSSNEEDNSANVEKVEAIASVNKSHKITKEVNMTEQKTVAVVEMIEKSQLVNIQKALDEQKVELNKALETIAVFHQEKLEQIQKSKAAQFSAVIKDEKLQAPIVKAALSLESDDDFSAFLAAIVALQASVNTSQEFMEKSALFQEMGASVNAESTVKESAVARLLKSKQAAV